MGKYGPEKTPHLDTFHAVTDAIFVALQYLGKKKTLSFPELEKAFDGVPKDIVNELCGSLM